MPHPFPHRYTVKLERTGPSFGSLFDADAQPIEAGAPVQFDGKPGYFSPETLLMSSIALCFMSTLESLAKRQNIAITNYTSEIEGVLEKTREGLVFTQINLNVAAKTPAESLQGLQDLVPVAKKYCIVANTLKVPIELTAVVSPENA